MSVPMKYKAMGDFHEYYSGRRKAPYPTIFIGGNHEASNYMFELYYGGWAAPNIYYLGAANVIRFGPLRISGLSGIWKGYDYRRPHYERLPYRGGDVHSIHHVRELDVRKLLQIRTQVDVGLSHDWPRHIEYFGDYKTLFRKKDRFENDSRNNRLGNPAAREILDRLRPRYWFSAHYHVRFTASITHGLSDAPSRKKRSPTGSLPDDLPAPEPAYDGPVVSFESEPDQENRATDTKEEARGVSDNPDMSARLAAWRNFSQVAARQEAAELHEALDNQTRTQNAQSEVTYELTWRKVTTGEDLTSRQVTDVVKTGPNDAQDEQSPGSKQSPMVKNADEIELDLSDAASSPPHESSTGVTKSAELQQDTPRQTPHDTNDDADGASVLPSKRAPSVSEDEVPESLRAQLPASFKRQRPEEPKSGSLPEAITNKSTSFFALDKCLPGRHFLELMELEPVSDQKGVNASRPFRFQYDKEWLAITRVFADHLTLGDKRQRVPPDLGEEVYRDRIIKEEAWVQEHIVNKGKLDIPENFEITAPVYDESVPINTRDMPREYNNPQTARFCELVGIENKFFMSDAELEARAAARFPPRHYGGPSN